MEEMPHMWEPTLLRGDGGSEGRPEKDMEIRTPSRTGEEPSDPAEGQLVEWVQLDH